MLMQDLEILLCQFHCALLRSEPSFLAAFFKWTWGSKTTFPLVGQL